MFGAAHCTHCASNFQRSPKSRTVELPRLGARPDWYNSQVNQCGSYEGPPTVSGVDLYDNSAFAHVPRTTVPENQFYTFVYTAKTLIDFGCLR
jgi:hypothetical protein